MRTYVESQNQKPFNWNTFIKKAIAVEVTKGEVKEATKLCQSWVTCACGNQCDAIPRNELGAPKDDYLQNLGMHFMYLIRDHEWIQAKDTLEEIECRSIKLLKGIKMKAHGSSN